MTSRWLLAAALACAACTGTETPPREKTAAYFGLKDGLELVYDVTSTGGTPTTARHIYRKNESFADELAFSREQRNGANFVEETLILAARDDTLVIMRNGDCVDRCSTYAAPPTLMQNPVLPGTSVTTESQVSNRDAAGNTTTTREKHEVIYSSESDVTTGAGTFKAMQVAWTISYPDEPAKPSVVTTFFFSENKGIVKFTANGKTYVLKSGMSP